MDIKILTDSGCDLPKKIIEEYNIEVLPLIVIKDDTEYLDGVDIKPKEVYDGMRNGGVYKTAQIPAGVFYNKFQEYAKNGDSVIYISFSSALSGTYDTSVLMKEKVKDEYNNLDLDIVDGKAATTGHGLIVYEAAKLAKEGKTKEEILNSINNCVNNIEHVFTADDIEYLYRGGRVSRSQAILGGLLNIKPILHVLDGKLVPIDKVRGSNKALKTMMDIIENKIGSTDLSTQTIGIGHGDDMQAAIKAKELLSERFGANSFIIETIGTAIGAHSGPGTLAICFIKNDHNK